MPIRQLNAADKTKVLEIDRIIFGNSDGGWTSEDFDYFFSQGSCFVFHEEDQPDEIIGYIFSGQNNKGTYISNIAVKNRHEGQGIGRELMKVVMLKELERSKDNVFSATLQVRADNERAKKLYERLGYQETSRNGVWVQMEARALPGLFLDAKPRQAAQKDLSALVREKPGVGLRQYQEMIQASMNKIDAALLTLENKMGNVDQHHFPEAAEKARTLLFNLRDARDAYYTNLKEPDCEIECAGTQFKQACEDAIHEAKPVLARDLSWGEYLGSIMRTLANAVITVFSLGQVNSFFTPDKSKSETAVEQAATDILNIGKANPH